jgi:hypothetical protein
MHKSRHVILIRPCLPPCSRGRGKSEAGGEKTWLWRDGLAVYAGDALEQQLLAAGLPRAAVAALRSEQPWRVAEPYRTMLMQVKGREGGRERLLWWALFL